MKQKAWSKNNETFRQVSLASINEQLKPAIYIPGVDMNGFYLEMYSEKYVFPYKVYGINEKFISRIYTTYENTIGNLGILMNGLKGTGKSVTSEIICNNFLEEYKMPVLLINKPTQGLIEFLANINQDVVIFVDEYEKVFVNDDDRGNRSTEILTLMDGALKSEYRRLFLFTTNNKYIDDNLLERPGRIRYVKEFSDLTREVIEELVDDLLVYPERREECVEFISRLKKITIDIVKAVVQEINIHNEAPSDFEDIFNAYTEESGFNVYEGELSILEMSKAEPKYKGMSRIFPDIFSASQFELDDWAQRDRNLTIRDKNGRQVNIGHLQEFKDGVLKVMNCEDFDDDGEPIKPTYQSYTIEKATTYHSSYSSIEF